jgi:MoxR-like ATPase
MDRFILKLSVDYPTLEEEMLIIERSSEPPPKLTPRASVQQLLAAQQLVVLEAGDAGAHVAPHEVGVQVGRVRRAAHASACPSAIRWAAVSTASMIWRYPVHRHRFPDNAALIRSRDGAGSVSSRWVDDISMPGVQ